jgi:hypothetical protein
MTISGLTRSNAHRQSFHNCESQDPEDTINPAETERMSCAFVSQHCQRTQRTRESDTPLAFARLAKLSPATDVGNVRLNDAPRPGLFSTSMLPP